MGLTGAYKFLQCLNECYQCDFMTTGWKMKNVMWSRVGWGGFNRHSLCNANFAIILCNSK